MTEKKILGIIPARGGSKGVKNKNIRLLDGKPLISYTIEAALGSKLLDEFIVSTDSEEIKRTAVLAGAKVPFLRPKEISGDKSSSVQVVEHALDWFKKEQNRLFDYIVLLQPTTPLRTASDIDSAIDIIVNSQNSNCLISCCDASHVHPSIMYLEQHGVLSKYDKSAKMKRRQEFEPVYLRNGALYIVKVSYFDNENRLVDDKPLSYMMPRQQSINIDEEIDLLIAELLIRNY